MWCFANASLEFRTPCYNLGTEVLESWHRRALRAIRKCFETGLFLISRTGVASL